MAYIFLDVTLKSPSLLPNVIDLPISFHKEDVTFKVLNRLTYLYGIGLVQVVVTNAGIGYKAKVRLKESITGVLVEEKFTDDFGVVTFEQLRKDIAYDFEAYDIAGVKNSVIRSGIYLV